jgi:hypothetical protein
MRLMGTQGGARCPGDTQHPWTSRPNSSPMTGDERGRVRSGAHCTASVVRRVTRGSTASSHPVPQVWRLARANRPPAPSRRLSTSSRPSSSGAIIPRHGGPRHCLPFSRNGSRAGRYPRAPRVAISAAARAGCPRHDTVDTLAIRVSPSARSWPPTRSGAPLARATANRATGSMGLRFPWPRATAAFSSAVKPALRAVWPRPRQSSPACAKSSVCPSASAPTTVCPVPPTPWAGSPHAPHGGSAWASSPRASSPAHPRRTAAMNACLARCRRTPLARPPSAGSAAPVCALP